MKEVEGLQMLRLEEAFDDCKSHRILALAAPHDRAVREGGLFWFSGTIPVRVFWCGQEAPWAKSPRKDSTGPQRFVAHEMF